MEDWKNTKCGNCVIQRKKPICNSCMEYSNFQPMSNADRIRSMSDEELAEFFSERDKIPNRYKCKEIEDWIKWLQSEAE